MLEDYYACVTRAAQLLLKEGDSHWKSSEVNVKVDRLILKVYKTSAPHFDQFFFFSELMHSSLN